MPYSMLMTQGALGTSWRLLSDLNNPFSLSTLSGFFNSFKNLSSILQSELITSHTAIINNTVIPKQHHKDLGVTLSEWSTHHDIILSKAYKTLGLIRRTLHNIAIQSNIPT